MDAVAEARGEASPDPVQVFHYLYAVAYCPTYRRLYADELRRGFPRFPLPPDRATFERLAELGRQLVELHVGRTCLSEDERGPIVVGEPICIGGYEVLRRWQRPRQRAGMAVDPAELSRLAWIGCETRRLMQAIDKVEMDYAAGSPHPPPPGVSIVSTSPG
jgi:hypothetical protein